jgi:hypothetical protein
MPKYAFLSHEWVGEAKRIYAEAGAGGVTTGSAGLAPVRVNLVVTDAPFSSVPIDAHVDTSAGRFDIDVGHLDHPDVTISLGYDTARSLFVQGDVQAVLQAFLGGRIKVDGDLSKLLDPRSGIFPGTSGSAPATSPRAGLAGPATGNQAVGGPAPAPGASAGDQEGASQAGSADAASRGHLGQQGFGFGGQHAMQVATLLQEITE